MEPWKENCPVCLAGEVKTTSIRSAVPYDGRKYGMENRTNSDDADLICCQACGEFVVTEGDQVKLLGDRSHINWIPSQVSALLREQNIRRLPPFWIRFGMDPYGPLERADLTPITLPELLGRWPRTVADRIDRTLSNLARLSQTAGAEIDVTQQETIQGLVHDTSLAFAETQSEAKFTFMALVQYGLIKCIKEASLIWPITVALTPNGWVRFEELTRGRSDLKNPVFVAMWFGGEDQRQMMDEAFNNGILPAIEHAGYRATRSDLVEHNDWIMDKILGDIRVAPFVVADFTQNRNGVYLEAGFARGLGLPGIHTCKIDHLENTHFDTAQLNHVLWSTPDELCEKLYHRILGTIGQGPHPFPPQRGDGM